MKLGKDLTFGDVVNISISLRKDKRDWINGVTQEQEVAASQGQMNGVYEATRRLCNKGRRKAAMLKNREGKLK